MNYLLKKYFPCRYLTIKNISIPLFIIFSIANSACQKFDIDKKDGFTIYTIKKGHHASGVGFRAFTAKELNFVALFDSSAIYTNIDSLNQLAINKLFGFSDCSDLHHENSARFGWRWYQNEIQIFTYCYKGSVRTDNHLTSVKLNEENNYQIKTEGNNYIFIVNGISDTLKNGCSSTIDYGKYFLYPFFGGTETAPHEIKIRIRELKE